MPTESEPLRNRMSVLADVWAMIPMRFSSNPRLATVSQEMFTRYVGFVLGHQVWGMYAKGTDGRPIASPHISHVLAYVRAICTFTTAAMNAGLDFQWALEKGLADEETRRLSFDIPFTHDSATKMCTALTAAVLTEVHSSFPEKKSTHHHHRSTETFFCLCGNVMF